MKPNASESAPMGDTIQVVLCTCPDESVAQSLAGTLVARRLAACVNIVPAVQSVYRWQDEVMEDTEALMVIKSNKENFAALQQAIADLHPYEVPEVLAMDAPRGSRAYQRWLLSCLAPEV